MMEKVAFDVYLAPEFDPDWDEGYYYADGLGGLNGPYDTVAGAKEALAQYQRNPED